MQPLTGPRAPRNGRRRFLRAASGVTLGLPLSLSLPWPPRAYAQAGGTPQRMTRRKIPSSGEALPVVGCGTWRTFDVGNDANAQERLAHVLQTMFDAGGSVIDSSPMYGSSEAVAGTVLTKLDAHDKAFVATKVWTDGRAAGIAQMEESMRRLQRPRIDLMQVHNLLDWRTQIATLRMESARADPLYRHYALHVERIC
jgi:diketogulonate reductase-like aldo/keto reductase